KTDANDKLAEEAYHRQKQVAEVQTVGDRSPVWAVLHDWLRWLDKRPTKKIAPNTLERHTRVVQSFIDLFGDVPARDVKATHFEQWLEKMREERVHPVNGRVIKWDEGSIKLGLGTMRQAFKWALARDLISKNPFHQADAHALEMPIINYEGKKKAIE